MYIQPYSSDEKYPELSAAHCHRIEIEISIVIISYNTCTYCCCWFSLVSSFGKLDILFTKPKRTNLKLLKLVVSALSPSAYFVVVAVFLFKSKVKKQQR